MISKPVPPAPAAPAAFAASAAVLLAGRSPKTARAPRASSGLPPLPALDVSKYNRDVLTFKIDGKTEPDEVPVYFNKETKADVYIHNVRSLMVLCGVESGSARVALHNLLKSNLELRKVILKQSLNML